MARIAALAGVATLALVVPLTAAASAPEPVRIETHGFFTGPDSTAGTFTASGALADSGTYADTFRLAGDTLHVVKTLSGSDGTITLAAQGVVQSTSPTTATFFAGHWRFVSGAGRTPISRGAATRARPDRRTSQQGPSKSSTKDGPKPTDILRDGRGRPPNGSEPTPSAP